MKKIFSIAAIAALTLGMASCAKEDGGKTQDGSGLFKIHLQTGSDDLSRAPITDVADESKVTQVEIWIFEAGGATRPDATVEGQKTYFNTNDVNFAPEMNGTKTYEVNVPLGESDVLVVANANLGENPTAKMEDLMNMASKIADAHVFTKANNASINDFTKNAGFVMAGQALKVDITAGSEVTVAIDRNVAKILPPTPKSEIEYDLTKEEWEEIYPGADDATLDQLADGTLKPTFSFYGYAVLNGLPKSTAGFAYTTREKGYDNDPLFAYALNTPFNYGNPWVNWSISKYTFANGALSLVGTAGTTDAALGGRLLSDAANMDAVTEVNATTIAQWAPYAWVPATAGAFTTDNAVYVHESRAGEVTNQGTGQRGYHYQQVVSYIVGGVFTANGLNDSAPRFWRVNMRDLEAYHILRNSKYSLEIAKIVTPGSSTPWEAEEEEPFIPEPGETPNDFIISINPWNARPVANDGI